MSPLAESITFSLKNVGEEEERAEDCCKNERPEAPRQDADSFACVGIVNRVQEVINFVSHSGKLFRMVSEKVCMVLQREFVCRPTKGRMR